VIEVADESDGCDCGIQIFHVGESGYPALHRAFTERQAANTPSAINLIPRLWFGSSFFSTALDVEP
jgi:hypothetical protein